MTLQQRELNEDSSKSDYSMIDGDQNPYDHEMYTNPIDSGKANA